MKKLNLRILLLQTMYFIVISSYGHWECSTENNEERFISLQKIPSGFYLIKIEGTNAETIIEKFIKQ